MFDGSSGYSAVTSPLPFRDAFGSAFQLRLSLVIHGLSIAALHTGGNFDFAPVGVAVVISGAVVFLGSEF